MRSEEKTLEARDPRNAMTATRRATARRFHYRPKHKVTPREMARLGQVTICRRGFGRATIVCPHKKRRRAAKCGPLACCARRAFTNRRMAKWRVPMASAARLAEPGMQMSSGFRDNKLV